VRKTRPADHLGHERRLANLARAGDHLDEPAALGEATEQLGGVRTRVFLIAHDIE